MKHTHTSEKSFPRRYSTSNGFTPVRGVRQDNRAPTCERIATVQIASPKNTARAHQMDTKTSRPQNYSKKRSTKRKTVQLTTWLKTELKAELQRIAREEKLSLSATAAAILEEGVRQKLHIQHAVLLQPIIETTIRREIHRTNNRLAVLLVMAVFGAEQTRGIITNILNRQPGMTPAILDQILDGSRKTAQRNLTRRSPQLEKIM